MPINIEKLTHTYMPGTPFEAKALCEINLKIEDGEFVGLIGHTGSGKSTLIQHINGLLKPTSGILEVNGITIKKDSKNLKALRQEVGLVFQYPEHQLFEETVEADVAFGPRNLGLNEGEILTRVKDSLKMVGLDYEMIKDRSPFDLSGGQMRRVAIAGVLAIKPKILILDEPTSGLDPRGRIEILSQIKDIHQRTNATIVFVSHSMDDIAKLAKRVIVLDRGCIVLDGKTSEVFLQADLLTSIGLGVPQFTRLMLELKKKGFNVNAGVASIEETREEILKMLKGGDKVC